MENTKPLAFEGPDLSAIYTNEANFPSKDVGSSRGGWHSQHPHPHGTLVAQPKSDKRAARPLPRENVGEVGSRHIQQNDKTKPNLWQNC
jgi:hypothetical protein